GSDQSLCNYLAFWTGNSATRMDSMFRESGLMRDKWDVIHFRDTNETYGERTIANAIASTPTTILDNQDQFEEFSFDFLEENTTEVVEDKQKKKFRLTELGNAERIAYEYGHIIKYVNEMGWLIWDGKRWRIDTRKEIERIT
ncbi:phage NrS-1 polymerase family protein, partial [Bacillus cereus]